MALSQEILGFVLMVIAVVTVAADDPWMPGRATWFDIGPDMSKANCHFSWAPTGRNVGAWPDVQYGFSSSCGKCFEVKCRNAVITDGYGSTLQRTSACYDENKSVVITIVDACPCHYPNNQYSNSRWCCGDENHIDLSQEAFEQIADLNIGVIGLVYREVDCSTVGSSGSGNGASNTANPSPDTIQGNTGNNDNSSGGGGSVGGSSSGSQSQGSPPSWTNWLSGWKVQWGH